MDWEALARWGWGVASGGLGWWLHVLWTRHHEMAKQLNELIVKQEKDKSEILLGTELNYARKTEIAPLLRDIRDMLERFEAKQEKRLERLEGEVFKK